MPTTIETVSNTKVSIVRRAQYLTQALNMSFAGSQPRGIVRGFNPIPSASPRVLTLEADDVTQDSVAVLRSQATGDATALVYKEQGSIDLDLAAFAGTLVHVCLFKNYTIGAPTVVEIRAYSDAEYIAGDTAEAVYVCSVNVPGAAVVIPIGDIGIGDRDDQYRWQSETGAERMVPLLNWSLDDVVEDYHTITVAGAVTAAVQAATKRVRSASLKVDAGGGAGACTVTMLDVFKVVANRRFRAQMWWRPGAGLVWNVVHALRLYVAFYDLAGAPVSSVFVETDLTAVAWTETVFQGIVPATATYARVYVVGQPDAGTYCLEDVQVLMEKAAGTKDWLDRVSSIVSRAIGVGRLVFREPGAVDVTAPYLLHRVANVLTLYRSGGGSLKFGSAGDEITGDWYGKQTFNDSIEVLGTNVQISEAAGTGDFTGDVSAAAFVADAFEYAGDETIVDGYTADDWNSTDADTMLDWKEAAVPAPNPATRQTSATLTDFWPAIEFTTDATWPSIAYLRIKPRRGATLTAVTFGVSGGADNWDVDVLQAGTLTGTLASVAAEAGVAPAGAFTVKTVSFTDVEWECDSVAPIILKLTCHNNGGTTREMFWCQVLWTFGSVKEAIGATP